MRKFLSEQSGRSMIEMLGVLAIIGVLSVGGIAGYSKAMAKYKQNKLGDQISMLITNIRTLYGNSSDYSGLTTESAISMGAVDKEMQVSGSSNTIHNVYTGNVTIAAVEHNSVSNSAFTLTIEKLPKPACTYMMSADWGSSVGSGWISIKTGANSAVTYTVGAAQNPAPATVAQAAAACDSESDNKVIMTFQ